MGKIIEGEEIVIGDNRNNGSGDNGYRGSPMEHWKPDFKDAPSNNNIEKILEFPDIDDMAGVLARANFRDDRQRVAAVRLAYKNAKFKDVNHQHMLRNYVASSLGMKALGKILQLQTGTNLMAPAVLREVLSMKQNKSQEEVHRGSDFREAGRDNNNMDNGSH